jgi:hypothetical protein
MIAQGRKAVTDNGTRYVHDSLSYMVISSHLQFESKAVHASEHQPFLSFVLQIAPGLVRKVSAEMLGQRGAVVGLAGSTGDEDSWMISAVDDELPSRRTVDGHRVGGGGQPQSVSVLPSVSHRIAAPRAGADTVGCR